MFGLKVPRPTQATIRTFALLTAAPLFGSILAWQLYGLEPERLCKTTFDLARIDGAGYLTAFKACFALYEKGLDIKDHAIIGLLAILGLGYIMMLMRELRMQGEFTGPGGIGGKFKSDPETPLDGAKQAEAAVKDVVENLENQ
jgi:hypothetical protein